MFIVTVFQCTGVHRSCPHMWFHLVLACLSQIWHWDCNTHFIDKETVFLEAAESIHIAKSCPSDSGQPQGLQHTRLSSPSLALRFCSNSCPLSQRCYLNIASSAAPFSFGLQPFPASRSFPMNWLFTSGGQSIGASASASVLPMNIQDWFSLGWTDLISLCPRSSEEYSPASKFKSIDSSVFSLFYGPTQPLKRKLV